MRLFGGRETLDVPQNQEEKESRGGRREDKVEKKHTYKMREELISIGDDYWIENEEGQKAFLVDGKALHLRETLLFKDAQAQGYDDYQQS